MACVLTKAYLLATIRALLNDPSTEAHWSDETINNWINEAAIDISAKALCYEGTDKITTVANTLEYNEPSDCIKVHFCVLYEMQGGLSFTSVALLGSGYSIYNLTVRGNKLYGFANDDKLYEWNDSDAWVAVSDSVNEPLVLHRSLCLYNNKFYVGTWQSKLYEWNDSDAWVEVAGQLESEHFIYSLAVYNNKLYGTTGPHAKLYEWNDSDAWVEVAGQLEGSIQAILSLAVYNNKLYGGTATSAKLYEWNDSDAWVEVAGQLESETIINSLAVYNNKLYGGTYPHAKLYEWNDSDAWVEVADQLESEEWITDLIVYNGKLYGSTEHNSYTCCYLVAWNDVDAWEDVVGYISLRGAISSLISYNGELYGATSVSFWTGYGELLWLQVWYSYTLDKALMKIHPRLILHLPHNISDKPKYYYHHHNKIGMFPLPDDTYAIEAYTSKITDDITDLPCELRLLAVFYCLAMARISEGREDDFKTFITMYLNSLMAYRSDISRYRHYSVDSKDMFRIPEKKVVNA